MARMKFLLLLVVVLVPGLISVLPLPVSAQAPPGGNVAPPADQAVADDAWSAHVRSGYLTTVSEFQLSLAEGEELTLETANVSEGGNPVLHLIDAQTGREVAVDDDSGPGTAAHITLRPDGPQELIVVVRSRMQETAGTADLLKNGEVWKTGVPFAGWHTAFEGLEPGEQLRSVHRPGGKGSTHRIYVINQRNDLSITLRAVGGGPNGAAIANLGQDSRMHAVIVGVGSVAAEEQALLLRNDVMDDGDGDGLGKWLEAALGTCSSLSGFVRGVDGYEFDCSLAADPRDTDGDGISDGLEVFGRLVDNQVVATDSTLAGVPAYPGGDVVASFQSHLNLPMWGADPRHKDLFIEVDFMQRSPGEMPQKMTPAVARQFAAYYQDTLDNPHPLVDLYRAVSLLNPDGKRGINTHLDIGVAPETPDDATIYGDWGGYNAVPPVQNAEGEWVGDNPHTAWQFNMNEARRGVFRYILAYPGGGGQNPINSFAASGPLNSAWVLAHEFAHAMGLDHGGKPGEFQPNCKPNYQSLLNYGFQGNPEVGFSDGVGTSALNNTALKEFGAVDPSNTSYLDVLENTYKYFVDREHGHVDWNRDGFIASEGTTVRAYANYKPGGGGCEFTRMNSSMVPDAASTTAPAMARLGDRLYLFYSPLGAVFYKYSTDAGNCPQADLSACATWSNHKIAYMDAQGGIDVIKLANNSLLVVTIDQNGNIWERRLSLDSAGNEIWTDHKQIPGVAAKSEPSLSEMAYCKSMLAYRGADGQVRYNYLSCADNFANWQGEQLALDQDGNPIPMADYASPGIGRAFLSSPGDAWILGAFAGTDGRLDLYRYNDETSRWAKTDLLEGRPGPIEGRPAMAWVESGGEFDRSGKFYLMYIRHDTRTDVGFREMNREVRMLTSYVKVDKLADGTLNKTLKVGLEGPFDNIWLYAFGIDLFYEAGIDSNLKSALSIAIDKPEIWAGIQFRPKSDGIADMMMTDHNDWEIMRIGLCKNVVNPGGLISNPITCPTS
ncbi:hypothetical protein BH23CHL2_BH23CHL2_05540 [soil metagenome]